VTLPSPEPSPDLSPDLSPEPSVELSPEPSPPAAEPAGGGGLRPAVVVALAVAVGVGLLGFPLGALWNLLAPHIPAVMTDEGPVYADPNGEQPIGVEGTYVFITLGTGIVLAILAWALLRRYRGVAVLLGLAVGGVGGGWLTWWYGHSLGRTSAPVGTRFPAPVNLRVKEIGLWHHWLPYVRGDLLFLAFAAILTYVLLAGFSPYPSLRKPGPGSVGAAGDGQFGQWHGYRPDPAEESDLPTEQGALGP